MVERGRPVRGLLQSFRREKRVSWDQESSSVGGEESDSGGILTMEPIRFADGLGIDVRDNKDSMVFELGNSKNGRALSEMGTLWEGQVWGR